MKVICAGLQKTGTKTMAESLRMLGYEHVHDVFEQYFLEGHLWKKVLDNTATKEDFKKAYKNVDAVSDYPANAFWEDILEAFPDAKVILMVRSSEEEWFQSLKFHYKHGSRFIFNALGIPADNDRVVSALVYWFGGPLLNDFLAYTRTFHSVGLGCHAIVGTVSEKISKSRYRQHNLYVQSRCPPEQLLVFNTKDGWEPLCKFLGKPVPSVPFPKENAKSVIFRQVAFGVYKYDMGYIRRVRYQAFLRLLIFITTLAVLFGCLVC